MLRRIDLIQFPTELESAGDEAGHRRGGGRARRALNNRPGAAQREDAAPVQGAQEWLLADQMARGDPLMEDHLSPQAAIAQPVGSARDLGLTANAGRV